MFKKIYVSILAITFSLLFCFQANAGTPVIAAGQEQVLTISESGTLWSWGSNKFGQLGVGEGTDAISIPVQVTTDSLWTSVSCGYKHNIAVKDDGSVWGWGLNLFGQVGNGEIGDNTPKDSSDDSVFMPVQITDTVWSNVSGGAWFSAGLKDDGTIWGWGYNLHGQLGKDTGSETKISTLVQAGADNQWVKVSAGHEQALALKDDSTIWGWGFNGKGSLGDGTTDDKSTPSQINNESDWLELYAGYEHTLAIKKDGTLWVWGRNDFGQVGDGNTTNITSTLQIGSDNTWKLIRGGGMHSVAIKNNGTLWAWGRNDYGQLGDGTNTDRHTPKQIGTDSDWQIAEAGFYFTVAMKSNGEVWTWGSNNFGQLGDGTNSDRNAPVKVKNLALYEIPDIEIKSLKVPKKVKVRKKAIFKVVIKNSGTASASASKVSFYISSNKENTSDLLADDILLGSKKVKVIEVGKKRIAKFKWKVPKKYSKKKYFVKVFCDSKESVDESSEDNNIKSSGKKLKIIK